MSTPGVDCRRRCASSTEMADDALLGRLRVAADACDRGVFWHHRRTPAEVLGELAATAADLEVSWDRYGEHGAVTLVEERLVELFGTGGAMLFPSGTMAQQCALRVWADRNGTSRVALPDLSHLLVHELDGPRLLQGLVVEHLTTGPVVATAEALERPSRGGWRPCSSSSRCAVRAACSRAGRV